MRPPAWLLLLPPLMAAASPGSRDSLSGESPMGVVGAFTDLRQTDEHAYGYSVQLWRSGAHLFGLFTVWDGPAGDPPTGLLESVRHDEKTGALSFRARVSEGLFSDRTHRDVPSRDIYEFSGVLGDSSLRGLLRHTNALTPQAHAIEDHVTLGRSSDEEEWMMPATTFGEWQRQAEAILRRRGPRW